MGHLQWPQLGQTALPKELLNIFFNWAGWFQLFVCTEECISARDRPAQQWKMVGERWVSNIVIAFSKTGRSYWFGCLHLGEIVQCFHFMGWSMNPCKFQNISGFLNFKWHLVRTGSMSFNVIYNMVQTLPLLQDVNGQVVALLSLSHLCL